MPPHEVYIETHLGSGAVLRNKRPSHRSFGVDIDADVIREAQAWSIPGLSIVKGDALKFIESYNFIGKELVYLDPPYPLATRNGRRYYRHEYSEDDHQMLLETIKKIRCNVMISSYPNEIYDRSLASWQRHVLTNVTHAGLKSEIVWTNFALSDDRHDYSHIGQSFRERERIRRKVSRWLRNLEEMPSIERQAILAALVQSSLIDPDFVRDQQRGLDRA